MASPMAKLIAPPPSATMASPLPSATPPPSATMASPTSKLIAPPPSARRAMPTVNLYPLGNYKFGTKAPKIDKDSSGADRIPRFRANYEKEGTRTSVEAILLVHEHNHPHILLFRIGDDICKLPGGRLKPGENEIEGMKRKLGSRLGINSPSSPQNWQVGECIGIWWRPSFETLLYLYLPPHITKPKECKKLFLVHLSEKERFAIPNNLKLFAVPLFELCGNSARFGTVISAIPIQLSRFNFRFVTS